MEYLKSIRYFTLAIGLLGILSFTYSEFRYIEVVQISFLVLLIIEITYLSNRITQLEVSNYCLSNNLFDEKKSLEDYQNRIATAFDEQKAEIYRLEELGRKLSSDIYNLENPSHKSHIIDYDE